MAQTTNSKQVLLHVEQMQSIRTNHPPTADALEKIIDYINKNVAPVQGNKVSPK
jgi:hypothetical protein